jgi:predicted nucleic acid-binding protein
MGDVVERVVQPVLVDNTVLTNFALVDRAKLVTQLWPTAACTTPSVLDEYRFGAAHGLVPADAWAELTVVKMTREETTLAANFPTRLGAGERSCLAVAICRGGLLASDDLDARRIAQQQNVPVTGTIGILTVCVRRDHLSREEANNLLAEMIALGYHAVLAEKCHPYIESSGSAQVTQKSL